MNLTADEIRKYVSFKGEYLMYYKDGKNLFFKTTKHLYKVLLANSGRVVLKVFRTYKKVAKKVAAKKTITKAVA